MSRRQFDAAFLLAALSLGCVAPACSGGGCGKSDPKPEPTVEASGTVHGLTAEQGKQVLLKVGDTTITAAQFAERLSELSPYLRARYNSPERRREFLDNMVRFELLAIAAREKGLDKAPEVERTRKEVMVQKLMESLFEENGIKPAEVTEAEIKAYYDANHDEFSKPEQVRASHILIKNRATAERVLKEVLRSASEPSADHNASSAEKFRILAREHNQDPATKERFGDLRFFSRPENKGPADADVPDAVRLAAFGIAAIGGVHPDLVQSDQGFHIIKLTGKRAALVRTLDEARRLIQNRLWRERREQAIEKFIAELRSKASVEEHLENLAQVKIEVSEDDDHGPPGSGNEGSEHADPASAGSEHGGAAPSGDPAPTSPEGAGQP